MTGAQSLIRSLEEVGADTVFGIPGGAILPAYDPLMDSSKVRHVLVRHEQGAGTRPPATRRPPAGSASAWRPRAPARPTWSPRSPTPTWTRCRSWRSPARSPAKAIGTDAFQEADICGITMPITKHNFLVTDAADIPRTIAEAFHIASTGRPGPVLVDIAKDALQATTTFSWPPQIDLPGYRPVTKPHAKQIREAARLIADAQPPGALRRRRRAQGRRHRRAARCWPS